MQERIENLIYVLPVLLISVAIHEFAHCWTIDRLGDDTPRNQGRVTLNPLVHLDPIGTIMMVASTLAGFGIGWGRPSPFNPANFRNPARDRMITAAAGPFSNILQMLAWGSLIAIVTNPHVVPIGHQEGFIRLCDIGIIINAALAVFNLLPIYPLDGHHILSYLAPPSLRPIIDDPRWRIVLLFLIFTPWLNKILGPMVDGLYMMTWHLVGN